MPLPLSSPSLLFSVSLSRSPCLSPMLVVHIFLSHSIPTSLLSGHLDYSILSTGYLATIIPLQYPSQSTVSHAQTPSATWEGEPCDPGCDMDQSVACSRETCSGSTSCLGSLSLGFEMWCRWAGPEPCTHRVCST